MLQRKCKRLSYNYSRPLEAICDSQVRPSSGQAAIVTRCADAARTALHDGSALRVCMFDNCVVNFNRERDHPQLNKTDTRVSVHAEARMQKPPERTARHRGGPLLLWGWYPLPRHGAHPRPNHSGLQSILWPRPRTSTRTTYKHGTPSCQSVPSSSLNH